MIDDILILFKSHTDSKNAIGMKAYMKDNFEFFGIKSPIRKEISKQVLKNVKSLSDNEVIDLIEKLWKLPQRELHYLALDILLRQKRNKWKKDDIQFLEWLALNNSWWDSIDFIAPKLMADYFLMYPEEIDLHTRKWLNTDNKWLIRCAILFQLKYKDKTDLETLYKIILDCCGTKEFFINKAIGWVLRENSKRIPNEIKDFVMFHEDTLSNLSKKEALRLITI